jgi:Spy/CpxP family protein refolding chaperone
MNQSRICTMLLGCAALVLAAPGTVSNVARAGTQDVHAQTQHAAAADMKQHHACLEEERASIERGEGFGMAMPADHAGYPGPRHVLDMAADLKLSSDQRASIQKIFDTMHEKAVVRGKELFESEARLEQMFRDGRPEADLREQSFRVDSIHAELRWIHLSAHLAAQKILTTEQIAQYTRLRHAQM